MEEVIRGKVGADRQSRREKLADRRGPSRLTLLDRIDDPSALKELSSDELLAVCREIREYIIDVVSEKGGHLGASLGVVELTVALARTLDLPKDRVVWDTGHQAYVHKVLTGRRDALWTIRQFGGISGFLKRDESAYDTFGAGHASTAISAALGMAAARDLADDDYRVVGIIGDGAITGGLAYEALNNAGHSGRNLLVILNDNGMSIAPNVGAMSQYLTSIQTNPHLIKLRDESLHLLRRLPALGEPMGELAERLESAIKSVVAPGGLFRSLGFNYHGPVDGHDLDLLLDILPRVLEKPGPLLLHVLTRKGKGLPAAEADHESFHGVTPFDKVTGRKKAKPADAKRPAYTAAFGRAMVQAAKEFPKMVAITAAMPSGTGLGEFSKAYPDRFHDVGIAEAHGVCFAAGLACEGARPVVTIYSTFLQRAFDQIVHDVALQDLPVVFALDRAGLVGADGPTHHGTLDLSYLRCVPGMVVAAPKDGNELEDLLWTALGQNDAPFAIRYPRDKVPEGFDRERRPQPVRVGSWEILEEGGDVALLAVGTMVRTALEARKRLAEQGVAATVVNCRFVKPLDHEVLRKVRGECGALITIEENSLRGGFGEAVIDALVEERLPVDGVVRLGLPDRFVTHGTRDELLETVGLTAGHVETRALEALGRSVP